MPYPEILLIAAGLLGGFAAGLIGIGGGIVFAPVLLFYFHSIGVPGELVTPLAIGTSLLCTMVTSTVSAINHGSRKSLSLRVASATGVASAFAVLATTIFVTTQPWYDRGTFGIAFSVVLLVVAIRMFLDEGEREDPSRSASRPGSSSRVTTLVATGSVAGVVSSAVGVGGGVILVPAYRRLLRLPIHVAIGTSSATIILISLFGVLAYVLRGAGLGATPTSIGFVDPLHAAYLSIPAAFTARAGARSAHRINQRRLQRGFAVFAILVAIRIIAGAIFG